MLPYWLLFAFFAAGAMLAPGRRGPDDPYFSPVLLVGALGVVLMIGLRDVVGVDWVTYVRMFDYVAKRDLMQVVTLSDPAYQLLNWIAAQIGAGVWLVNLLGAAIFSWGFWRFARIQPFPWLAFLIAVPYLIIVVAMNYSRQAVAIGLVFAGLASLSRGSSIWKYVLFVAAAGLFHASALVALPLALIGRKGDRLVQLTLIPAIAYFIYGGLGDDSMARVVNIYVKTDLQSQGAAIRIAMCVVPALLYLSLWRRMRFEGPERDLWRNFSIAAFALLVLLLIFPSSTVIDRLALYLLPLQVAVLARLPFVLNNKDQGAILLVIGFAAVLYVWLNYAANASAWIPYRMIGA